MGMGMGRNWELLDGTMGMKFKFLNGNGTGMGIKSLKWVGYGTTISVPSHL